MSEDWGNGWGDVLEFDIYYMVKFFVSKNYNINKLEFYVIG